MQSTSRLRVNPALGAPPTLEFVGVPALRIDDSYQRTLDNPQSRALIRRIATYWDWALCQPLVCSRRPEQPGVFVVDGQHRLEAARLRGDIAHLPCVITSYASNADEAASFVQLNQQRRPLSRLDLFKAALASEDGESVQIAALIKQAGLTVASHSNHTAWKPGQVSNVGGIQRCFRTHGRAITLQSLGVLAEAFRGQVLRYCGTIFAAIYKLIAFERAEEKKLGVEALDLDLLVRVLAVRPQADWMRAFDLHRGQHGGGREEAAFACLQDCLLEALAVELGLDEEAAA